MQLTRERALQNAEAMGKYPMTAKFGAVTKVSGLRNMLSGLYGGNVECGWGSTFFSL